MNNPGPFIVRNAKEEEFKAIGELLVNVYSQLHGFPKPSDQPDYYHKLAQVGQMTAIPEIELLVAATPQGAIGGAVVFIGDMKYYGSGGKATTEKNASGFRLLGVNPDYRKAGIGKLLTHACIEKARGRKSEQLIIHSTKAMQVAWGMYERLGFKRSEDLDFMQGTLPVYGFRLVL